eukprot:scaffold40774_cov72-Phaeocystis_antarctica.AAC.4
MEGRWNALLIFLAHGANAACLDGCPARGAISPLRVRFLTHGSQADSFWQEMRTNAIGAASTFGADFDPEVDWVWSESDATQAATIRSHTDTSVALIVSAQSEEVATAVRDAAEALHGQSAPLAVPQLGPCASPGCAWRLWAA